MVVTIYNNKWDFLEYSKNLKFLICEINFNGIQKSNVKEDFYEWQ